MYKLHGSYGEESCLSVGSMDLKRLLVKSVPMNQPSEKLRRETQGIELLQIVIRPKLR